MAAVNQSHLHDRGAQTFGKRFAPSTEDSISGLSMVSYVLQSGVEMNGWRCVLQ